MKMVILTVVLREMDVNLNFVKIGQYTGNEILIGFNLILFN